MMSVYMMGVYAGRFLAGAVVGGLIPFIIFAYKKRWGLALLSFLIGGAAACYFNSIASVVSGVALIAWAILARSCRI